MRSEWIERREHLYVRERDRGQNGERMNKIV